MSGQAKQYREAHASKDKVETSERIKCGVIMPISPTDGYPPNHWVQVYDILSQSIEDAGDTARIVSESDETSVIHKSIIRNIYMDEIVVCDVSSRNPNVMFELGMRLTFGKPVVIVKDRNTVYPFDISLIKYVDYDAGLRFPDIVKFKDKLTEEIKSAAIKRESFLDSIGGIQVSVVNTQEVSSDK